MVNRPRIENTLQKIDNYVMKPIMLAGCYLTAAAMLHHAVAISPGTQLTPSQAVNILEEETVRPSMQNKKINLVLLHDDLLKKHGIGALCLRSNGEQYLMFDNNNLNVRQFYHELTHVSLRKSILGATISLEEALKVIDKMYEKNHGKISLSYILSPEEFICNARAIYMSYRWNHKHPKSEQNSIDKNIYLTQQHKTQ